MPDAWVLLEKDCDCRAEVHTGPHWLHVDVLWSEANQQQYLPDNMPGYLVVERRRLEEKRWHLRINCLQDVRFLEGQWWGLPAASSAG